MTHVGCRDDAFGRIETCRENLRRKNYINIERMAISSWRPKSAGIGPHHRGKPHRSCVKWFVVCSGVDE